MQSAYSISTYKGKDAYFVNVDGISIYQRDLFFQVDPVPGHQLWRGYGFDQDDTPATSK